ncbi:MAG: T9SS type A sorting domain-containing protein [Bacteroidota bacterium]|nr:T9SS type A sorting domain-containing protein [Bacteroidota bacterium]
MKGKLLIVGGGSERNNSGAWSNAPYQWALDQSTNKKVAIIGVSAPSDPTWLPNYFIQLGAVAAKNFTFGSVSAANIQSTYDSLMTYDVIFFRGGDQSQYYTFYKNTFLMQAVKDKFNDGGVIAGTSAGLHILSGVIYNALDASITSDQALNNVYNTNITLANDFFALFPGYIFDSHFNERGRFGRLITFLANWKLTRNQMIGGVGVHDLTAMGIDTNEVGLAFGTGAIHVYKHGSKKLNPYSISGSAFYTDSLQVSQLLNGWKYNFKTNIVTKPSTLGVNIATNSTETFAGTILISGIEGAAANTVFVNQIVQKTGFVYHPIMIITTNTISGKQFSEAMLAQSATSVNIARLSVADSNDITSKIRKARKIMFADISSFATLSTYLASGKAGKILDSAIRQPGAILGFVGGTGRFVGKTVVSDNYLGQDAAYFGNLSTTKGLQLLRSFYIFPNAFSSSIMFENASSSVPYFMLKDTIAHGVWINGNSIFKYAINTNKQAVITSEGYNPVVILKNDSTTFGFSTTTSRGDGSQQPRQVAGFNSMKLSVLSILNPYVVGKNIVEPVITVPAPILTEFVVSNSSYKSYNIVPNPCTQSFELIGNSQDIDKVYLINTLGNVFEVLKNNQNMFEVKVLPKGVYTVQWVDNQSTINKRILIQ